MKLTKELASVYYTAAEARKVLGLDGDTFQYWGRTKRVTRVYLPGREQPVYSRKEIESMATQIAATILVEHPEALAFRKATIDDIEKEAQLAHLVFGAKAEVIDARKTFLERNPDIDYHLYEQGQLVAYINVVPLKHQAIEQFLEGKIMAWNIDPNCIEDFTPNNPTECLIIDMVTTPTVPPLRRTTYGSRLLAGVVQTLSEAGRTGIEITKIYAASETPTGIRILRNAGFKELYQARKGRISFELDVANSDEKILREYQEALKSWKSKNNQIGKNAPRRRKNTSPTPSVGTRV